MTWDPADFGGIEVKQDITPAIVLAWVRYKYDRYHEACGSVTNTVRTVTVRYNISWDQETFETIFFLLLFRHLYVFETVANSDIKMALKKLKMSPE